MTTDSENMEQYLNFISNQIFYICPSFLCHVTPNLEGSQILESTVCPVRG